LKLPLRQADVLDRQQTFTNNAAAAWTWPETWGRPRQYRQESSARWSAFL